MPLKSTNLKSVILPDYKIMYNIYKEVSSAVRRILHAKHILHTYIGDPLLVPGRAGAKKIPCQSLVRTY